MRLGGFCSDTLECVRSGQQTKTRGTAKFAAACRGTAPRIAGFRRVDAEYPDCGRALTNPLPTPRGSAWFPGRRTATPSALKPYYIHNAIHILVCNRLTSPEFGTGSRLYRWKFLSLCRWKVSSDYKNAATKRGWSPVCGSVCPVVRPSVRTVWRHILHVKPRRIQSGA
jgi:hypothetical protein